MTRLTDFYQGKGPDIEGRMFFDILQFDHTRLEQEHTHIQWLFPLPVRSKYNPTAPIITPAEVEVFCEDRTIQKNLELATVTMQYFLSDSTHVWLVKHNHNHLRISRMLKSLKLCGHSVLAYELHEWVQRTVRNSNVITTQTYMEWARATTGGGR